MDALWIVSEMKKKEFKAAETEMAAIVKFKQGLAVVAQCGLWGGLVHIVLETA